MATADLVLWVGISFQQSASTQYFRNVSTPLPLSPYPYRLPQLLLVGISFQQSASTQYFRNVSTSLPHTVFSSEPCLMSSAVKQMRSEALEILDVVFGFIIEENSGDAPCQPSNSVPACSGRLSVSAFGYIALC